jgi:hypothetical protein
MIAGKFTLSIPEYLSKTDGIDPAALLQYKNEKEQLFLLVYEKKDSLNLGLASVFKIFSDDFIARMEHGNLVKYYPMQITSHRALIGNIRGTVHETEVYYKIAVIPSGNSFYEILIGITENRKSSYEEDLDKIIGGFRSIP